MAISLSWPTLSEYAQAYQSLDYVVASWERHNNASDDNAMIIFVKCNLERCTRGETITSRGQSKNGVGGTNCKHLD